MNEQVREQQEGGSNLPLWAGIALLLAGVVGYYMLDTQSTLVRWAAVVGGFVAGAVVFGVSARGRDFLGFVVDARSELRKVFWPTKNETWITTLAVFIFAVAAGAFFWLLDLFLAWATRALTGQGG
jgi:preprotein translocase subunit SecE